MTELRRIDGTMIASGERTLREIVEHTECNLVGAALRGADLMGANLRGASLWGASLMGANLRGANLRGASLRGANLRDANLRDANLAGADLRGADLWGACFLRANLQDADLMDAGLNWRSHDLLAEVIRQNAGDDHDKRAMAGLVLVSRDWCWRQFWELNLPLEPWAIEVLTPFLREGQTPPWEVKP